MGVTDRFVTIECESLKNLNLIVQSLETTNIEFIVIGGYALSVYCPKKRFTKDIDIATSLELVNPLIAQLKRLDFEVDPFVHGTNILRAAKPGEAQNIELHASIGEVFDETTSNSYPCANLLADKNHLEITPFLPECEQPFKKL